MIWPWLAYSVLIDVGISEPFPKFYRYSGRQLKRLLVLGVVHEMRGYESRGYEFTRPYGPEVAQEVLGLSDPDARVLLEKVKARWKAQLGKPPSQRC